MAEGEDMAMHWSRLESAIIKSFSHFRDRYLPSVRRRHGSEGAGKEEVSPLQCLPVDVQLYIMSYVSPRDLCRLGCTSNYWHLMVHDPVLWRYFLLRDLPSWSSIDWTSLPSTEHLKTCCAKESDGTLPDYMSIYLKSSRRHNRKSTKSSRPKFAAVSSFLHSLVVNVEPRFAMFGPGLEQLDDSLVRGMMSSPDLLPVVGFPQRQINGIGSGITFLFNNHQRFNILTLYSTTSKERERARTENNTAVNKIFVPGSSTTDRPQPVQYSLIVQVQHVCRLVDGFIYVANAETKKAHQRQEEAAHIVAMTDENLGPVSRPFLVLSCITQAKVKRIPCIYMAHELGLNQLNRPWMVQDAEVTSLNGLLDGIEWLLEELGIIK